MIMSEAVEMEVELNIDNIMNIKKEHEFYDDNNTHVDSSIKNEGKSKNNRWLVIVPLLLLLVMFIIFILNK